MYLAFSRHDPANNRVDEIRRESPFSLFFIVTLGVDSLDNS